jgi:hypothetical protein
VAGKSGALGGEFKRKNTKRTTWAEAKVVVALWESAGTWEGVLLRLKRRP